jgi:6,7-dimethyl-8-ribityllumazine synthase
MTAIRGEARAEGLRVAIVVSRCHETVTRRLLDGALAGVREKGGDSGSVTVVEVPGAFEIPAAARALARAKRHDAIVCLGAVVRGETPHFDYVCAETSRGIAEIALEGEVGVGFGLLTTETLDQAAERAGGRVGNKGWEAAVAAFEMASLLRKLR